MNFISVAASVCLAGLALGRPEGLLMEVPDTPYLVKWTSQELVDHDRVDPWNSSHSRRLMISRFMPVRPEECTSTCRKPWIEPEIVSDLEVIFGVPLSEHSWPKNIFGDFELEVCCEEDDAGPEKDDDFPLVLFGVGFNATRYIYSAIAQHVAGMGYEVVVMDHPYESDVVRFPDGSKIYGGRITFEWDEDDPDTPEMARGQAIRVADSSFVLDALGVGGGAGTSLDMKKIIAMGHSTGGAAAAALMLSDSRVVAGVNLDGTMFGSHYGTLTSGVDGPFLILASKNHTFEIDRTWRDFWDATVTNYPDNWLKVIRIKEAQHGTYGDFALAGDLVHLREDPFMVENFIGNISGSRAFKIIREHISDFIRFSLGEKDEGLVGAPSPDYPDVEFVREAESEEL